MRPLSLIETDRIRSDISRANISIATLQEELMDHICCEVELLMEQGRSFEEAYQMIREHASVNTLQDIQEETFILINKHYALMKTTMKLSGTISLSAIAIGTLMRFTDLPGANIILVAGFVLLTFLFIPAAVFLDSSITPQKQLIRRITLLLGCIALSNGVLFKVMHWSGANVILILGCLVMWGMFLPQVITAQLKRQMPGKEKAILGLGAFSVLVFSFGILFKLMHWPGTAVLFVTGGTLLIGLFVPLYALVILQKKERAMAPFIYLVILSIYVITMTGLISIHRDGPQSADNNSIITHSTQSN